jgi:hypothetical protein
VTVAKTYNLAYPTPLRPSTPPSTAGRKRRLSQVSPALNRSRISITSQQGFLNFSFVRTLPTGIFTPPHFTETQQVQSTQSTIIEQIQLNNEPFFIFAEHAPYNEPYTPRYYYIHSRIVLQESNARIDLNYMLWVVSNALTIAIERIKQNINQINHDNTASKELIFQQNGALKHTLDIPAKQMFEITKNLDIINEKLH